MRQALDHGERTVMLHEGRVVFDVTGPERKGLDVPDLLALFAKHRGQLLADDSLLLGLVRPSAWKSRRKRLYSSGHNAL